MQNSSPSAKINLVLGGFSLNSDLNDELCLITTMAPGKCCHLSAGHGEISQNYMLHSKLLANTNYKTSRPCLWVRMRKNAKIGRGHAQVQFGNHEGFEFKYFPNWSRMYLFQLLITLYTKLPNQLLIWILPKQEGPRVKPPQFSCYHVSLVSTTQKCLSWHFSLFQLNSSQILVYREKSKISVQNCTNLTQVHGDADLMSFHSSSWNSLN